MPKGGARGEGLRSIDGPYPLTRRYAPTSLNGRGKIEFAEGFDQSSKSYIRCTACGANRPIAVKASPATASRPDTQASAIMPVMMVADASTMPI